MASRREIAVLSTLALKGVLERFAPEFEQELEARLALRFDATQAILRQIDQVRVDLYVLTDEAARQLAMEGKLATVRRLGSSGVGVAVRAGAAKPDIGSLDAFKRAILGASSVAHSKVGASGLYFAELLQRLGLADRLQRRVVVDSGPVGRVVAAGEAEIGIQQLCELAPVPGIDIVGPLPDEIQRITHFSAGIPANAANPQGAGALLDLLRQERVRAGMRQGGIQPAETKGGQ